MNIQISPHLYQLFWYKSPECIFFESDSIKRISFSSLRTLFYDRATWISNFNCLFWTAIQNKETKFESPVKKKRLFLYFYQYKMVIYDLCNDKKTSDISAAKSGSAKSICCKNDISHCPWVRNFKIFIIHVVTGLRCRCKFQKRFDIIF